MTEPGVGGASREGRAGVVAALRAAGCVFAEDEAALLDEGGGGDPVLLAALVRRRVAGEPLEHVLGWVGFCGLRVAVGPGVFVPRQRTALVVARAARVLPAGGTAVDMCCGCGAIGAALAAVRPDAEIHACDLDPVAVGWARTNLPADRVHQGDLYDALPPRLAGRIDVLAANAPYVPTSQIALMPPEARDHEPPATLDGGGDGLQIVTRILAQAPAWLASGGHAVVEIGAPQATRALATAARAGLDATVERDDDTGGVVLVARLR